MNTFNVEMLKKLLDAKVNSEVAEMYRNDAAGNKEEAERIDAFVSGIEFAYAVIQDIETGKV